MKRTIYFVLLLLPAMSVCAQNTFLVPLGATVRSANGAYIVLQDMNLINNSSLVQTTGNGTLKFTGNTNVTLSGTGTTTLDNLQLAKGSGFKLSLLSNISVITAIDFSGGNLDLGNSQADLGTTGALTNESETSRALSTGSGFIQATRTLNAPSSVNVANTGAIITSASNLGNTVIRRSFVSAANSYGNGSSILRVYVITPTNNTALNATFRFQYLDAELNGLTESSLVLWKSIDNIHWTNQGFTTRNTTSNFVELTGVPSFSSWTLSSPTNALPVFFGNIKAFEQGSDIIVQWEALTELNTEKYIIQKSGDGSNFNTIGTVAASGLSNYVFADHRPNAGNNYYRLQSVDFDNSGKLSRIVKINKSGGKPGIGIFPNPATGNLFVLQFDNMQKGIYTIDVFNNSGQKVYAGTINHAGGSATETLQLPTTIVSGPYTIRIKNNKEIFSRSLILQ